jgi:hypothetical protein
VKLSPSFPISYGGSEVSQSFSVFAKRKPLSLYQSLGNLVRKMTEPFPSAGNSSPSRYVSAGANLAGSSPSEPKCPSCAKIWQTISPNPQDCEWPPTENLQQPCHGYPALANLMYQNPSFESFQAFRDLHIKSLLYYQGQLDNIRKGLHKIEWEDHDIRTFEYHEKLSKNVRYLFKPESDLAAGAVQNASNAPSTGGEGVPASPEGKGDQLRKVEEMRKMLKEYSKESFQYAFRPPPVEEHLLTLMAPQGEALLLYTKINELPKPDTFHVRNILKWLLINRPIEGGGANSWGPLFRCYAEQPSILSQFSRLIWTLFWRKEESDIDLDLVVPLKTKSIDGLTKWVESEGVPFWESVVATLRRRKQVFRRPVLPHATASPLSKRNSTAVGTGFTKILSGFLRKPSNDGQASEKTEGSLRVEKIQIVTYRYKTLLAITTFVTTLSASLFLPVVAILVVSRLDSQSMILGFIALFTGLFTILNMIVTPAGTKRTEIFNASAA